MRKIIVPVLALLLSGCAAAGERPAALEKSFTCTAVLTGENEYTAQLERAEGSGWRVKLLEPESAAGMELCYLADGSCTPELEGHTIVYPRESIPEYGPFDLITAAADMCIEGKGVSVEQSGGVTAAKGEVRGIAFTAESEGGRLTSIALGEGIRCSLENKAVKE